MRKIMIVDDDVTITTELEEFLFSRGYQVVGTTFSGDEAIEMAAKLRPDLILMDIDMPGKTDGITAAEEIRSSLDIPVLFLTGRSEGEVIERAKRAKPLGYIMKPFNEKQIDAAVQIALNKKDADQGRKVIQSELEEMVKERTAELAEANRKLRQEIDERKKNEQALQESEEKYRTILESIQEGYYELDLTGNYIFFNDALCKIRGYPRDELMGINFGRNMDKNKAKEVYAAANRVYTTGEPVKGLVTESVKKDGSKIYAETSISLIRDSEGKPIGFRGIVRDISEQRELQQRLQHAQKLEAMATLAGGDNPGCG